MAYRLKNAKLENFTNLAGTPPSPFRQKKIRIIGDDDEVITSSDMLQGDDSDFDIDYTGASNLEPIVLSNKKIGKKEQERIISEESSKPKIKSTIRSTEFDDIADRERYDETMAPLIEGFKDDVREGIGKAAQVMMDIGLMAAPMPGAGLIARGIGGGLRFAKNLFSPVTSKIPKLNLKLGSNPSQNFLKANQTNLFRDVPLQSTDDISMFSYFNKAQREGVKKYMDVLSQGAPTMKKARLSTIKDLTSPEGFKRLVNQELKYITDFSKNKPFNITTGNDYYRIGKTINPKDFARFAEENARKRIAELRVPSINEQLANIKSKGKFGYFNFNKAQDILYSSPTGYYSKPGSYFTNNAFADTVVGKLIPGPLGPRVNPISYRFRTDAPQLALGTGNLDNLGTAYHEISHVLQKGIPSFIDKRLQSTVKSKSPRLLDKLNMRVDENYFRTANSNKITEAAPFAREYIESLRRGGFLRNRYDKITPSIIKKSIDASGGKFSGDLNNRIIGLMQNTPQQRKNLANILNKVPTVTLPILGGATLKFSGDRK